MFGTHHRKHAEIERRLDLLEAQQAETDRKWTDVLQKIDLILAILKEGKNG